VVLDLVGVHCGRVVEGGSVEVVVGSETRGGVGSRMVKVEGGHGKRKKEKRTVVLLAGEDLRASRERDGGVKRNGFRQSFRRGQQS